MRRRGRQVPVYAAQYKGDRAETWLMSTRIRFAVDQQQTFQVGAVEEASGLSGFDHCLYAGAGKFSQCGSGLTPAAAMYPNAFGRVP